ncbi:MAG: ferredoxin [bacterium]
MIDQDVDRIELDEETCISAASCVALADKTFKLNDEGKIEFVNPDQSKGDTDEMIIEAARSCPVDAIRLFNKKGKRIWPK